MTQRRRLTWARLGVAVIGAGERQGTPDLIADVARVPRTAAPGLGLSCLGPCAR